jgi:hypothetical protein
MNSYRIDFIDNNVKISEATLPFNLQEGMCFTLPNHTNIFLTHNFMHEMSERIEDLNNDYEDETISDSLTHYYEV